MSLHITQANFEKRAQLRSPAQVFVRICSLDEPNSNGEIALTIDFNDTGVTLLTYIPLPVGTRIVIHCGEFTAMGEVVDWEWDYILDMARMGVRLIEQNGKWPKV